VKANDDAETNDDAEADDDGEVDNDAEAVKNTDSDKIKSVISTLDRPMRNIVARRAFRKSFSYYIK